MAFPIDSSVWAEKFSNELIASNAYQHDSAQDEWQRGAAVWQRAGDQLQDNCQQSDGVDGQTDLGRVVEFAHADFAHVIH